MARSQEFYRGSRKKRNYAIIPFVVLLALAAVIIVLFYSMQKYAVISKDGVEVVLPGMQRSENTTVDSQGHEVKAFEHVDTELVFDEPDYTRIKATAGKMVKPIKAIFVSADEIDRAKLLEYEARLNDGNALVIEMKPRSGKLMWGSTSYLARNYGIGSSSPLGNDMAPMLEELREASEARDREIYLVAQISCCIDERLALVSSNYALRTESGGVYSSEEGTWVDPYNADVRNYAVELTRELFDMGFDEVILADVMHPKALVGDSETPITFQYSREMSTTPRPETAACGFAVYVADQLKDRKAQLSIYTDSAVSLVRTDEQTGQNAVLFLKIYDRVYYRTDRYVYTYNLEDITPSVTIGSAQDRFVPVVINYIPHENSSWVLIDTETETQQTEG